MLLCAQSDIFSSRAHISPPFYHSYSWAFGEEKKNTDNNAHIELHQIQMPVCNMCRVQSECVCGWRTPNGTQFHFRERASISCNFESPCLITTILSHIMRHVQHSQMQYAVIQSFSMDACFQLTLHIHDFFVVVDSFPSRSRSFFSLFRFICISKSVERCFHQTAKDMYVIIFFLLSLPSPMHFTSICCTLQKHK